MLLFGGLAAISEIISDEKIVKLIKVMENGYKLLFAILSSTLVLFIVGITLIMKFSNNGMMYR